MCVDLSSVRSPQIVKVSHLSHGRSGLLGRKQVKLRTGRSLRKPQRHRTAAVHYDIRTSAR
jgi:hypothetical protein